MKNRKSSNSLRIIGGEWRGRRLSFPDAEGLRPTPDRVRETLFNWLQPVIRGARCLDAFAGSGALGLEALSRGAAQVTLLDSAPKVIAQLRENLALLKCTHAELHCASALSYLDRPAHQTYHVVFLDPPYHKNLLAPAAQLLEERGWLAPEALIYIEAEQTLTPLPIPANWAIVRNKQAGQVSYSLIQRQSPAHRSVS
ncbi:MAG: 16S rRNA (guanine(966)-N(2))-methyltransferase RsmD [Pseudomonadota bacterium]